MAVRKENDTVSAPPPEVGDDIREDPSVDMSPFDTSEDDVEGTCPQCSGATFYEVCANPTCDG